MKKITTSFILATLLFSPNYSLAKNFETPVQEEQKIFYGTIIGELKKVSNNKITIFLLQEKNGTIHQVFSSELVDEIKEFYINGNQVKILGQDYFNPNNRIYAGIFVKKIRDFSKKNKVVRRIKINSELTDFQKNVIYSYLSSNKSADKFTAGKKLFGDKDLKSLYKEMDSKDRDGKVNKEIFAFVKYLTKDNELNSKSKEFKKIENTVKELKSLDKKFLQKIESYGYLKIKKILNDTGLSDYDKYFFNELKNIEGFENFLDKKIYSEKLDFTGDKNYKQFSKIIDYKTSKDKIRFLFKNEKSFRNIFNAKKTNQNIKEFSDIITSGIILNKIEKNLSMDKFLPINEINSEKKVVKFLKENNTEDILKKSFSKDFQSKYFSNIKINFPQNFDYEKIELGNEIYSKIYLKDFYSNILSLSINKVNNFEKRFGEKTNVKISGKYGKKIISEDKIYYQIINKGKYGKEKIEISYSSKDKNFLEIFKGIINKIGN